MRLSNRSPTRYIDFLLYQVTFLLVTYILPLLGLSLTYTHLSRVMWKLQWQSSFSGNRDNDRRAKKEMRKVAKMFIVILIIFGVCWLPYHVYFLVLFYYPVSTIGTTFVNYFSKLYKHIQLCNQFIYIYQLISFLIFHSSFFTYCYLLKIVLFYTS